VIVLDASVAVKWFVDGEPLVREAQAVLSEIEQSPEQFLVPELFMNELLAVLAKLGKAAQVRQALTLVEELGIARIGNGHELLDTAATIACDWHLSGYDATYVALASLSGAEWLTADARAAKKVRRRGLVRVLGAGR
jgi:predicted nucleic acid-binding protein